MAQRAVSGLLRIPGVPIGSYVSKPITFLHKMDPRIKQAWLVALLLLPARSTLPVRGGVDIFLIVLAFTLLPKPVWKPQLTQLLTLSAFVFFSTALFSDSIPTLAQIRTPPPMLENLPSLPVPDQPYKFVLLHVGPIQVTRRGVILAGNAATLTFSILQSAHLVLCSTTPEELAISLRWYLWPLKRVGVPVEELVLTTLMALRFMSLVFEELRGLAVGVASRGVDWQVMRPLDVVNVMFAIFRRLLEKLNAHAEVISEAMVVRGFSSAEQHDTFLEIDPVKRSVVTDVASVMCLVGLVYVVSITDTL
eukprot:CAMPEP_0118927100 /NCGR_PEP_ID=MMETSP1169-20130426/4651_1 /TAXON_ID=36882 /ORGANISM="Pyramimonas obovata, Strain CCMP722" /LENGTH=306 /DNA_ID=CAMNT_0006868795 /DNA_START=433 /DNA_END=1353 /DNA_ORIENTATION=+